MMPVCFHRDVRGRAVFVAIGDGLVALEAGVEDVGLDRSGFRRWT
jgi:hypothetical protein